MASFSSVSGQHVDGPPVEELLYWYDEWVFPCAWLPTSWSLQQQLGFADHDGYHLFLCTKKHWQYSSKLCSEKSAITCNLLLLFLIIIKN